MEATNLVSILQPRADRIRKLMENMVRNTLAIGEELEKARDSFEIGPKGQPMGWKKWLREEFNLGDTHARRLISVHRRFGHLASEGRELPTIKVLRTILPENVPETARREVIERAQRGEKIGADKAKKIIQKHRPSPKKANEIARETGKAVEASDGYVYLGADPDKVKEADLRRTIVFSVREAITTLASIDLAPADFLEFAMPHQLWRAREERQIKDALGWLKELDRCWDKRK